MNPIFWKLLTVLPWPQARRSELLAQTSDDDDFGLPQESPANAYMRGYQAAELRQQVETGSKPALRGIDSAQAKLGRIALRQLVTALRSEEERYEEPWSVDIEMCLAVAENWLNETAQTIVEEQHAAQAAALSRKRK